MMEELLNVKEDISRNFNEDNDFKLNAYLQEKKGYYL